MHDVIRCLTCGVKIESHWQLFAAHRDCNPAAAEAALQAEFRAMERRNRERQVNLRLLGTGVKVKLGKGE